VRRHEGGILVRPTLVDHVTTNMTTCEEEKFGPVLEIVRARNFKEAVALPGDHNQHGRKGSHFYTNIRVITQCWPDGGAGDSGFIIPTMS